MQNASAACLDQDLEHYVVPAPSTSANSGLVYAANMTETPRSLTHSGVFSNSDGSSNVSNTFKDGGGISVDRPAIIKVYFRTLCCKIFFSRFYLALELERIINMSIKLAVSMFSIYLFPKFQCLVAIYSGQFF